MGLETPRRYALVRESKFSAKGRGEYLASARVQTASNQSVAMVYTVTTDKSEALLFCSKVAALAFLAAFEHHEHSDFLLGEI